jgi:protein gp37
MFRDKKRYGQDPSTVIRSKLGTFNSPLKWKEPAKVFVCSWSDFFIEEADEWRDDAWKIMRKTPHLTYQLLTKRPENIESRLPHDWPLPNVWLGVTAENQEMADKRIPVLLKIQAALHFISVEPMVGPVKLKPEWLLCLSDGQYMNICECGHGLITWVICGGESGPEARHMDPAWATALKRQCSDAGWAFFMKQMTSKAPIPENLQGREFPIKNND